MVVCVHVQGWAGAYAFFAWCFVAWSAMLIMQVCVATSHCLDGQGKLRHGTVQAGPRQQHAACGAAGHWLKQVSPNIPYIPSCAPIAHLPT